MVRRRLLITVSVALACLVLLPGAALAQSGMAGVVKDTTGAVLPGVTVEASSPALLEKVRSAVTDGQGRYNLVDLRPGVYTVAFTLTGFTKFLRDGLVLPAAFTATVDAELQLGSLDETITVSGAAPLVDVQNATQQVVLQRETLDSLPTGRTPQNYTALAPGVTSVNLGAFSTEVSTMNVIYHGGGSQEAQMSIDGDRINIAMDTGGSHNTTRINPGIVAEMTYAATGGQSEHQNAGIHTNLIPKEGGNKFSGNFFGMFSYDGFQANNLTDALRAKGLGESRMIKTWDINPSFGGPVVRDRLWFWLSFRNSMINHTRPNMFEDVDHADWVYTPDRSRPSRNKIQDDDVTGRLTWQATQKDKFSVSTGVQPRIQHNWGDANLWTTPATGYATYTPNLVVQGVWRRVASNKLYIEAGGNSYYIFLETGPQKGFDNTLVPAQEVTTGVSFRNNAYTGGTGQWGNHDSLVWNYRAAMTYATGSHNVKMGGNFRQANYGQTRVSQNEYDVHLRNGVPFRVQLNVPWTFHSYVKADSSLFVQDAWTFNRATINLGLRYDYFNGANGAETLPASRFAPVPRRFEGTTGTPIWHDISPRVGLSFDLFGDSRTALKLNFGRFMTSIGTGAAHTLYNQVNQSARTATRTFADSNGNFIPECNFTDPNANGECGRLSDLNFGTPNFRAATKDDDVRQGFNVRPNNHEAAITIQRELSPGISATVAYYRRWFGNFSLTENTLVGPADYDQFCITAPVHERLPGGGGYQLCGLYDVKPAKFGQVQNNVSLTRKFGDQTRVYNGVDLMTNGRFSNGVSFSVGFNVGRVETNRCFVVDSPQELFQCDITPPFQPNLKAFVVVPLKWGVSGTVLYQTIPGPEILANYPVPNAEIAPSLGRNLSQGAGGNVTVPLIKPGTLYAARQETVDVRLMKTFRMGSRRIVAGLDVNNLLNSSDLWNVNTNFGPNWLNPTRIMVGRYFSLNGQFHF